MSGGALACGGLPAAAPPASTSAAAQGQLRGRLGPINIQARGCCARRQPLASVWAAHACPAGEQGGGGGGGGQRCCCCYLAPWKGVHGTRWVVAGKINATAWHGAAAGRRPRRLKARAGRGRGVAAGLLLPPLPLLPWEQAAAAAAC